MYKLIGNKESFAVEIDFLRVEEYNKQCWIKSRLWIGGNPIGLFDEDENYLWPFFSSLRVIAEKPEIFWDDELKGLDFQGIFFTINPFFGRFEDYMKLSDDEAVFYKKYEKYGFMWGENFDRWHINVVVNEGFCRFLWVPYWNDDGSKNEKYNDYVNALHCFSVSLSEVQKAYKEVYAMIPNEYWER